MDRSGRRIMMNEQTGWHFSVTIPIKDKKEAFKELTKVEIIDELLNSCVPSYKDTEKE